MNLFTLILIDDHGLPASTIHNPQSTIHDSMIEKSFLTQRFAKLKFPQYHVIGFSMAGEETVCSDSRDERLLRHRPRAAFCLSSDYLCITPWPHGSHRRRADITFPKSSFRG